MYKISLITGDGIGPELSDSAISVLNTIQEKYGIEFEITKSLIISSPICLVLP